MRLHKALAEAGVCSRRKAEQAIAAGRVAVNGRSVGAVGTTVAPGVDRVTIDGRAVRAEVPEYWVLNKPAGVVASVGDPSGRVAARHLVRTAARVFPIGRLDATSTGVLLMTNDGALTHRLLGRGAVCDQSCRVLVAGRPDARDVRRLRRGVVAGAVRLPAVDVTDVDASGGGTAGRAGTWLAVTIPIGQARAMRRAFAALGHPVRLLRRERYGPVGLDGLPPGASRPLTLDERRALRRITDDRA